MINTMRDVVHKWQRQHGLSIHPDAIDDLVQQVKAAMRCPALSTSFDKETPGPISGVSR